MAEKTKRRNQKLDWTVQSSQLNIIIFYIFYPEDGQIVWKLGL